MARKKKQVNWENSYVDKIAFLNELYQERVAFLATFILPDPLEEKIKKIVGETTGSAGTGEAAGSVPGNGNEEKTWNFFSSKGFSAHAIAGIMGNLKQESGIDPTKKQYGGGPGRGLCQWEEGGRWNSLLAYAQASGKSEWDIETQLGYLWEELNGKDPTTKSLLDKNWGGIEGLKKATDYKWACDAFEKSFERAGKPNMPNRYKYAEAFYEKYKNGTGSVARGDAKKVIEIAESWLNKPNEYVFGGGRSQANIAAGKFDCSSWVRYVFEQAGHNLGDIGSVSTNTLIKAGKQISRADLQPGDLVFFDTYKTYGHVTIYLGNEKCIGTQGSTGVAVIDMNQNYWKTRVSNQHRRVLG